MPPRGRRGVVRKALGPEPAPVIGHNLVERIYDIIERISLQRGPGAGRAMEEMAEIVNRLLALALLPDDDVHPQAS